MKLWLIAKSNMRRKKGNVAILFLLIMLSTMLFYTSVNVLKNINTFIDEKNESQNGAHACFVLSDSHQEEMEDILKSAPGYKEMETEVVGTGVGTNYIKNVTKDLKKESMGFLFSDLSKHREIANLEIQDKADEMKENSIVLPIYLKLANGYETGDEITITFGNHVETFEVYGFSEDPLFSTPSNVTVYRCMLTPEKLEQLRKDIPTFMDVRVYNVRVDDMTESNDYEDAVSKAMNNQIKDPTFLSVFVLNYMTMRIGASIFINILMAVMAIFSILIILIALIVIRFSINSYLEENLPNIGISEAVGYTTTQLIGSTMLEYLLITVCGLVAGFAVAGVSSAFFAKTVSASVGLCWIPKVDVLVGVLTVIVVGALIFGILFFATRKYKTISPLDALRVGITTHNFKKNPLPLSKWNFGINSTLGVKSLLHNKKQNFSVILIVGLLVYTCVISLSMYYNFVQDNRALVNLVGIEKPEIQIGFRPDENTPDASEIYETEKDLAKRDDVEKVYTIGNTLITVSNEKREMSVDVDVFEDMDKIDIDTLVEGRRPKHDNEINMTNVLANRFDLKLGDSITLQKNDKSESYVVVGITQQISRMGIQLSMSEDAMKRLDTTYQPTGLFVFLNGGEKAAPEVVDELTDYFENDPRYLVTDFVEAYNTVLKSFIGALTTICISFLVITAVVVIVIVLLTVRMKLVKDKKHMGVYKALGYTTPQIIWQTIMSFIPVVAAGALIGAILGCTTANKVFALMLSVSGIVNANLTICPGWVFGCFFVVTMLALIVAIFGALKIRKIEPYKMIIEG